MGLVVVTVAIVPTAVVIVVAAVVSAAAVVTASAVFERTVCAVGVQHIAAAGALLALATVATLFAATLTFAMVAVAFAFYGLAAYIFATAGAITAVIIKKHKTPPFVYVRLPRYGGYIYSVCAISTQRY